MMQEDIYYPHPLVQDILWKCLNTFAEPLLMQWPLSKLRHRALRSVMEHIRREDESTNYLCIGPVSKVSYREMSIQIETNGLVRNSE